MLQNRHVRVLVIRISELVALLIYSYKIFTFEQVLIKLNNVNECSSQGLLNCTHLKCISVCRVSRFKKKRKKNCFDNEVSRSKEKSLVYIIQTPGLSWQTSTSVCIKKGHVLINVGPTPDA